MLDFTQRLEYGGRYHKQTQQNAHPQNGCESDRANINQHERTSNYMLTIFQKPDMYFSKFSYVFFITIDYSAHDLSCK